MDDDKVSHILYSIYRRLRKHFGYVDQWWPGSPWRIAVTAMLVQQSDWTLADAAASRLEAAGLFTIEDLRAAEPEEIQQLISPVAFAPTKSKRMIGFADAIHCRGFDCIEDYLASESTPEVRRDLLTIRGIGEETADSILLYAGTDHPCFVIDAYSRRFFERVRLSPEIDASFWKWPSSKLRQFLEEHVLSRLDLYDEFTLMEGVGRPVALLRDYHAYLVEIGRHHCLKSNPRCRSTGRSGWKDYEACKTHCQFNGCTSCPVVRSCEFAALQRQKE